MIFLLLIQSKAACYCMLNFFVVDLIDHSNLRKKMTVVVVGWLVVACLFVFASY